MCIVSVRIMSGKGKPKLVVILGAGTAGLAVASELEQAVREHADAGDDLQLNFAIIDRDHSFVPSYAMQYLLQDKKGKLNPRDVTWPYQNLNIQNGTWAADEVLAIDTKKRIVLCRGHRIRNYAKLVIALESERDLVKIPGLAQGAFDVDSITCAVQVWPSCSPLKLPPRTSTPSLLQKCPAAEARHQ